VRTFVVFLNTTLDFDATPARFVASTPACFAKTHAASHEIDAL
jgi:hypothetical protein